MAGRKSILDMKTPFLDYAISTVQCSTIAGYMMKVANMINIDYTFLCTDMYGDLCSVVSVCPLEEVEARVYCTHVPPPLQITVLSPIYGLDQCGAMCYNSVWQNGSYTCMYSRTSLIRVE